MGFNLVHLFETGLLGFNALAIVNEKRVLRKYGLDRPEAGSMEPRAQIATFLHATRTFLRYPLVFANILVIVYEILLG